MRFNPFAPKPPNGLANPALFRCPTCKSGVMFDITSRLAEALGVLHHRCDHCHTRMATPKPKRHS